MAASLLRHSPGGSNLISLGTALVAAVLHGVALVAASLPRSSLGSSKFAEGQPWW